MSRSSWKGPFVDKSLINQIRFKKYYKIFKTKSRNSNIIPFFVGKNIGIYNGKIFHKITITKEMIGQNWENFHRQEKLFFIKKKK